MSLFDMIDADTQRLQDAELAAAAEARRQAEAKKAAILDVVQQRIAKLANEIGVALEWLPFQDGHRLYANLGGMIVTVDAVRLKNLDAIDPSQTAKVNAEFQAAVVGIIIGEPARLTSVPIGTVQTISFEHLAKTVRGLPINVNVRSTQQIMDMLQISREEAAVNEQEFTLPTPSELEDLFRLEIPANN